MELIRKIKKLFVNNTKYIQMLREDGVNIGNDCIIDKKAEFGTEPYLISIGNHVRITKGVCFITHDGGIWVLRHLGIVDKSADKMGCINIGDNTNIGWNAIIMPNVTIGKNCVIAAGAVVTKDIPDNSVWGGVPARFIENIMEYAEKNKGKFIYTKRMEQEEKRLYILSHLKSL